MPLSSPSLCLGHHAPPICAANMSTPRPSVESFEFLSPNVQQGQFPFPQQHDLTVRPSSTGGRYQPRRGSTASSIHSVGGILDAGFKANMGAVKEQNYNGNRPSNGYMRTTGPCSD